MFEDAINEMVRQSQRDNDRADGWLSSIAKATQAGDTDVIRDTIRQATALDAEDSGETREDGVADSSDRQ